MSINSSTKQYYVAKDGQTLGPYTEEVIWQCLKEGRLAQADYVLDPEKQEWISITAATFLSHTPETALPPLPLAALPVPPYGAPLPTAQTQHAPTIPVQTSTKLVAKNYTDVPWIRRAGFVNIFSGLGFGLWLFGGSLFAFLVLLFPTVVVLTGDVFTKKMNQDGSLQKWNWNYKLGPVVLCALTLLITIAVLTGIFK